MLSHVKKPRFRNLQIIIGLTKVFIFPNCFLTAVQCSDSSGVRRIVGWFRMDVGLAYFEIKDTTSECNSWIQLIWGVHELNSYGRPVHEREVVSYSWALAEWLISSLVTKDLRGGRVIPQSGHQTISKDFAISNLFAHFCHLQRSKMSDEEDLDKETIGRKVKIQSEYLFTSVLSEWW